MTQRLRLLVALFGVAVTALLPLSFPANGGATGFDRSITSWVHTTFTDETVNRALLQPSQLYLLVLLMALGAAYFVIRARSPRRALVVGVAPILAVALVESVCKPLFGRHLYSPYNHHTFLDYPSGSTVALIAVTTAFAVTVTTRRARAIVLTIGTIAMAGVAVGLIWFDYHHPTDIVGGITFAVAVTVAFDAATRMRWSDRENGVK